MIAKTKIQSDSKLSSVSIESSKEFDKALVDGLKMALEMFEKGNVGIALDEYLRSSFDVEGMQFEPSGEESHALLVDVGAEKSPQLESKESPAGYSQKLEEAAKKEQEKEEPSSTKETAQAPLVQQQAAAETALPEQAEPPANNVSVTVNVEDKGANESGSAQALREQQNPLAEVPPNNANEGDQSVPLVPKLLELLLAQEIPGAKKASQILESTSDVASSIATSMSSFIDKLQTSAVESMSEAGEKAISSSVSSISSLLTGSSSPGKVETNSLAFPLFQALQKLESPSKQAEPSKKQDQASAVTSGNKTSSSTGIAPSLQASLVQEAVSSTSSKEKKSEFESELSSTLGSFFEPFGSLVDSIFGSSEKKNESESNQRSTSAEESSTSNSELIEQIKTERDSVTQGLGAAASQIFDFIGLSEKPISKSTTGQIATEKASTPESKQAERLAQSITQSEVNSALESKASTREVGNTLSEVMKEAVTKMQVMGTTVSPDSREAGSSTSLLNKSLSLTNPTQVNNLTGATEGDEFEENPMLNLTNLQQGGSQSTVNLSNGTIARLSSEIVKALTLHRFLHSGQ